MNSGLAPMRILIAGWRDARPQAHSRAVFDALRMGVELYRSDRHNGPPSTDPAILVHGACHKGGVDAIAAAFARRWEWTVEPHPAIDHPTQHFGDWPGAGPRRNAYMVGLGADVVVGLPGPGGSVGTLTCINMAARAGLLTLVYPLRRKVATP